jgi:hypothetical protein
MKKKFYDVEAKWTLKTVAMALLQGNAKRYAQNPDIWIQDANDLTARLMTATDLFARKDTDESQDT